MSPRPRKRAQPPSERTKLRNVALFKDEDEPTVASASSQTLQIEQIITSSSQPRRYFDPEKLEQLTQSVKEHGILEPLLVRSLPDNKYELVAGERRYRAAVSAGLTEVPVVIKELTDTEALQLALVENLQREDLNPVEETEGILQLIALRENITVDEVTSRLYRMYNEVKGNVNSSNPNVRVNEFDDSIKAIFDSLLSMNWESFVKNKLPLLNLPEDILEALRSGQIEYTKAKAIATLKDEAARAEILEEAIANSLSLSQIKERVSAAKPTKEKEELRSRFDVTYKQAKKSKQLWQDPKKRKKLESLLSQLEKLIESESSSIAQASNHEPSEEEESNTEAEEKGLSDQELGELLGVSNLIIRDYRVKRKKPRGQALARALTEQWEVKGERWVRKS
ncbi:ParB/RepB/Spo0J family partition protein [Pleurocapsales cyanobacterium LEGE 06147]|nr:ParB/RepB/Spo0J family partition protein [Pleurocapsales cyanobacterium LEGE 06147]